MGEGAAPLQSPTIAMQASRIGRLGGPSPRKHGAARMKARVAQTMAVARERVHQSLRCHVIIDYLLVSGPQGSLSLRLRKFFRRERSCVRKSLTQLGFSRS